MKFRYRVIKRSEDQQNTEIKLELIDGPEKVAVAVEKDGLVLTVERAKIDDYRIDEIVEMDIVNQTRT